MGSAMVATVVGYTTKLTKEAGASSVRLRLVPGRHARPEARSSGDGEIATPSCSTLAIRAGNRLGFLAAIGALIGSPEGISMEAVVFGRPNEALVELMPLEEATLQELYPMGSTVDVRLLRSMPFEQFQEPAAPSGPVDTPAEAAAEAEPLRSPKAEWMVERLLQLASMLEFQFAPQAPEEGAYEGSSEWLDSEAVQQWLQTAGLRVSQ
ncbi:unnamed protein product [Cladocopium goreaui]|uniref:Uncharacterized protein n=1 Tax=Cladocopium goreaui TaxID=2562237 RepID=A0A9P1CC24_9DINO|nr:unnamed protein product [Cladocopium goreaui]